MAWLDIAWMSAILYYPITIGEKTNGGDIQMINNIIASLVATGLVTPAITAFLSAVSALYAALSLGILVA